MIANFPSKTNWILVVAFLIAVTTAVLIGDWFPVWMPRVGRLNGVGSAATPFFLPE
jgi:hypothetical protein